MSRTKNTIKNTAFGLVSQIATILINFINRTIFIEFLGVQYLGLNGLFSNILSMLSLSELGLGVAITFSLYKPLAESDERKVKALMNFYCKAYRIIGVVILSLGLALVPFLDFLIKDKPDIANFEIIYILFLLNTVLSYFFTYKRSLLSADQKEYINTTNRMVFHLIQSILYFLVLIIFKNYLVYLTVTIVCTVASNIEISIRCNKIYPYLKNNKEKLKKDETKTLMKYVFAQMSHKVGGIVVSGTDNLLTTSLLKGGLSIVGLYSNYLLITSTVKSVITIFFNAVTASVGNLNAQGNIENSKRVFNKMFFLNMCFYGVTSACIFNLANDFILIWLGKEFLLSKPILVLIVLNYYITGMRQSCITYNTTLGLFWNDRFKPWIEAFINLVASILLAKYIGFAGILCGTLISTLTTSFWIEPFILYKHGFKTSVFDYFKRYIIYTAVILIYTLISYFATAFIAVDNFVLWALKTVLVAGISIVLTVILFCKTEEFKFFFESIKNLKRKRKSL